MVARRGEPQPIRMLRPQISHTAQPTDICLIICAERDADPGCVDVQISGPGLSEVAGHEFDHAQYVEKLRTMADHLDEFAAHLRQQARDYAEAAWQEAGIVL